MLEGEAPKEREGTLEDDIATKICKLIRESGDERTDDVLGRLLEYLGNPRDPSSRFSKLKDNILLGTSIAWTSWRIAKAMSKLNRR